MNRWQIQGHPRSEFYDKGAQLVETCNGSCFLRLQWQIVLDEALSSDAFQTVEESTAVGLLPNLPAKQ